MLMKDGQGHRNKIVNKNNGNCNASCQTKVTESIGQMTNFDVS